VLIMVLGVKGMSYWRLNSDLMDRAPRRHARTIGSQARGVERLARSGRCHGACAPASKGGGRVGGWLCL
jgi:hypothetical protein